MNRRFSRINADCGRYHPISYYEDRLIYEQALEKTRSCLDPGDFQSAWAEGRAMGMKQVVVYALTEIDA
jgi:hypothetical protein